MATIGNLSVIMKLSTGQFTQGVTKVGSSVKGLAGKIASAAGSVGGFTTSLLMAVPGVSALVGAFGGLADSVRSFVMSAISAASEWEKLRVAFTGFLGGAEKADAFLKDIADLTAKTPFRLDTVATATQRLIGFGFAAEESIEIITRLGDVAASMPGDLAQSVDTLVSVVGTMRATGRATWGDIQRLAQQGIPVLDALAKRLNMSVSRTKKMLEQGMIDAATGINAIIDVAKDPRIAGAMERQSETIFGLWSTFQDNIQLLMVEIGNAFIEGFALKDLVRTFTTIVQSFKSLMPGVITAAKEFGQKVRSWIEYAIDRLPFWVEAAADFFADFIYFARSAGASFIEGFLVPVSEALITLNSNLKDPLRTLLKLDRHMSDLTGNVERFKLADTMLKAMDAEEALSRVGVDALRKIASGLRPSMSNPLTRWLLGPTLEDGIRNMGGMLGDALRAGFAQGKEALDGMGKAAEKIGKDMEFAGLDAFATQRTEIAEKLLTPLDLFFRRVQMAQTFFASGAKDAGLFGRELGSAFMELESGAGLNRTQLSSALDRGSTEAAAAIQRFQVEETRRREDPQARVERVLNSIRAADARRNEILQAISRDINGLDVEAAGVN